MVKLNIKNTLLYIVKGLPLYFLKLAIYLLFIVFHNLYIYSYYPNNPCKHVINSAIIASNAINKLGYIYADYVFLIFGKTAYFFGILPYIWFIKKAFYYARPKAFWLKIVFTVSFLSCFSLFCFFLQLKLSNYNFFYPAEDQHKALFLLLAEKLIFKYPHYLDYAIICLLGLLSFIFFFLASGLKLKDLMNVILFHITFPIFTSIALIKLIIKPLMFKIQALLNNKPRKELVFIRDESNLMLPDINLLEKNIIISTKDSAKAFSLKSETLLKVLKDFGISGNMVNVIQGPVVTTYEFKPSAGIKASRVIGLCDDIARALCATSTRIANVAGKNVLGIEIPNNKREFFGLRELLETNEFKNINYELPIVLGKNLDGSTKIVDLAQMPHLLIAGTTGSGKSVFLHILIMSLLFRYGPEKCQFIMIDPKMLELSSYANIPNLLVPTITDSEQAIQTLSWAVKEMNTRYEIMSDLKVKNLFNYNKKCELSDGGIVKFEKKIQIGFDEKSKLPLYTTKLQKYKKLPYIVIIIDEMADLMLAGAKEVEVQVQRLAQMARAAGIHLVMATQRPSVDVITGVIKANFPSRISFKLASKIDSRTILGESGAEQLLGMGDMLYMSSGMEITRVHAPFITEYEIEKVAEYLKSRAKNNKSNIGSTI
jgi:S-DNA-T family DNA segregation ATPase FtsK/SpoIIIE